MNNIITLRKIGGFYLCFDNDAIIISYLCNYKIKNGKVGFRNLKSKKGTVFSAYFRYEYNKETGYYNWKMEFIEAYQIMAMLYTFSEHAMSKKHLVSLESMISDLYDNEIDEIVESKKRMLWIYPNFCIIAMLILVFTLAAFMFISIMGEVSLG